MLRILLVLGLAGCPRAAAPPPAVADVPPDPTEVLARANQAYEAGDFARCATLHESVATDGVRWEAAYNAACCHALAGHPDDAFRMLDLARQRGMRDPAGPSADADFASLHADSRWAALIGSLEAAVAEYRRTLNVELLELHDADQADRQGDVDWSVVAPRDAVRLKRVHELVDAGIPTVAADYFHAALVLQHSNTADDFLLAHQLALKALELDPTLPSARWLAAAAKDRWLQRSGQPQIYGTQYNRPDAGGPWTMEPIDETAVTDEERAQWDVPPLAESKRRLEQMNAAP